MCGIDDIKTDFLDLAAEIGGILMNLVTKRGALSQHCESLVSSGCDRRCQRIGEQVRTALLTKHVNDLLTGTGVAAGSSAERFAKGAGDHIDSSHHTAGLRCSFSMFAHETNSMGIVHHDQRIIFIRQITDSLEIGNNAVHGENSVSSDHLDAGAFGLFQAAAQIIHVVVFIAEALCFAETNAIDNAGMIELIRDDGIFRSEQGLEKTAVRIEAGAVKNGIIHAQEITDLFLQVFMQLLRSADKTYGA